MSAGWMSQPTTFVSLASFISKSPLINATTNVSSSFLWYTTAFAVFSAGIFKKSQSSSIVPAWGVGTSFNSSFGSLFSFSTIDSAASTFALYPHSGQIAIESSPAGVRSIYSWEIFPPIIPESDFTTATSGIPHLAKILQYAS